MSAPLSPNSPAADVRELNGLITSVRQYIDILKLAGADPIVLSHVLHIASCQLLTDRLVPAAARATIDHFAKIFFEIKSAESK
jgi:hypothetical protein